MSAVDLSLCLIMNSFALSLEPFLAIEQSFVLQNFTMFAGVSSTSSVCAVSVLSSATLSNSGVVSDFRGLSVSFLMNSTAQSL